MKASSIRRWGAAPVAMPIAALRSWPLAASAQLGVLISGGFPGPCEPLLPEFERSTGTKVATGSGPSQGTGPQTIASQLARGVLEPGLREPSAPNGALSGQMPKMRSGPSAAPEHKP
jgi:hypothetical protein